MAFPAVPIHGKLARIQMGGTASAVASTDIDYTSRWSINWTKDAAVFGRQGQEYKEALPGQAGYTGSGEFIFVNSSEQSTLMGLCVTTDATVALTTGPLQNKLKFCFDSTLNFLAATAVIITGLTFDAPVGDLIKCGFTFQGSGSIKFVEYASS